MKRILKDTGWESYQAAFRNGYIRIGAIIYTDRGTYSARPDYDYLCDSSVGKPNNVDVRKAIGSGCWKLTIQSKKKERNPSAV